MSVLLVFISEIYGNYGLFILTRAELIAFPMCAILLGFPGHSEPPGEDMPSPAPTQSERQDFCQPGVPHGDLWSAVTGAPVARTQAKMHLALYRQPHGAQGPFGEALDTTWRLGHYDTLHLLCLRAAGSSPSPSAQTHQSWDSNSTLPDLV